MKQSAQTVLLVDANVLIDYRNSEIEILKLVGQHVGRVVVPVRVLEEVRGLSPADCERLSMVVVETDTGRLLRAGVVDSSVSFNDSLCFLTCREEGWTCVTNDKALQRLCQSHAVNTRFGLGLLLDLVAVGAITRQRAMTTARKIHASNPLHINERVIARFMDKLSRIGTDHIQRVGA